MKITAHKKLQKGFTLIELLVVIAVLGVLAAVVMVAINPGEQLARGRDSGRKSAVGQMINAMQSYYTASGSVYPTASTSWITTLTNASELKAIPAKTQSGSGYTSCTGNNQNDYCYFTDGSEVVVYTRLESQAEKNKCNGTGNAYFLWPSSTGTAGVYCKTTEPVAGSYGTYATPQ